MFLARKVKAVSSETVILILSSQLRTRLDSGSLLLMEDLPAFFKLPLYSSHNNLIITEVPRGLHMISLCYYKKMYTWMKWMENYLKELHELSYELF